MRTIEFETELNGKASLAIPAEVAAKLPQTGKAKVVLMVQDGEGEDAWRHAAYEQFLRYYAPEDSVYDKYL